MTHFKEIANTLAKSISRVVEATQFFKKKAEVSQQVTHLADSVDVMVKESILTLEVIEKKQEEFRSLYATYEAQQAEIEKILAQTDPLVD